MKNWTKGKNYKLIYESLPNETKLEVNKIINPDFNRKHIGVLLDIANTWKCDILNHYELWKIAVKNNKQNDSVYQRFGDIGLSKLKSKKSETAKNRKSTFNYEYWMEVGLSEIDAKEKVKNIQSNNGKKAWLIDRPKEKHFPYIKEFWMNKGYSVDESISLVEQYRKRSSTCNIEFYIKKYGIIEGPIKYEYMLLKRNLKMLEKYGSTNIGGVTSKESILFFTPLYEELIKFMPKEEIFWGVEGSREFASHHNGRNYFYDFTIKNLKIIIEYNNIFWHPRNLEEWKSTYYDYETKKLYDEIKINHMKDRGYDIIIVWNDDNFEEKRKYILEFIRNKIGR